MVTVIFLLLGILVALSCLFKGSPVRKFISRQKRPKRTIVSLLALWTFLWFVIIVLESPDQQQANVAGGHRSTQEPVSEFPDRQVIVGVIDGNTLKMSSGLIRLSGVALAANNDVCRREVESFLSGFVGRSADITQGAIAVDKLVYADVVVDGESLSVLLARKGWAEYFASDFFVAKKSEIQTAIAEAKGEGIGIWSSNGCAPLAEPKLEPPVAVPTSTLKKDTDGTLEKRIRTGGHSCLPGERDGDGDGYCGEGRR